MRISAGKVFMSNTGSTGTASALLHLKGTGDAIRVESTNTGVGGAQVDLIHYTTSPADDDIHGVINFGGYYSGTDAAYGSSIRSVWSDVSAKEGQLEFWTRDDSEFAQRLKIDHDGTATFVGSIGIGSTASDFHADADDLVVGGGSGNTGITIHSGTGGLSLIHI